MRYLGVREPTDWERSQWRGTVERVMDFVGDDTTDRVVVPIPRDLPIDDALMATATLVANEGLIEARRRPNALMPGEMQLVEGVVERVASLELAIAFYNVIGLQAVLRKWVGRKVSITIEDVTE